ncbi:coiled-coil domain-containing protein 116 isoform X2 [Octodon degus]|uniref:Coiled-coil domain-containing protein 116 isoform X2 n=1 Tax=Octodon degus TaxID=10160 RepID=A0A6P6E583_OCTDE|nr:coiled-coil domain-containing protein 116 isoform X2 [Octodon degus]
MAGCRHHSGYLADDEAGHSTHMARVPPPKKPLLPEMGPAFKLGRVPHPPLVDGSSAHQSYYQTSKRPQPFGSFLDFLTEGQVLDNLQTVVEEATERVATMKTEAGVPLVEVQDSIEVPCVKRQKGWSHSCSQRDSLLWNSLGSQTGSHWTQQQPLSWFSGLVGSSSGASEASELRPGERELIFLKGKFKKEKSLLSQPASFDLPGYCVLREPHRTLDFLAKHHLFPALQSVVSQAADKLRAACCHDGCPLFPTNSQLVQGLSGSTLTEGKEPCDSLHTTDANPMLPHRKSRSGLNSSVSNAQGANRVKLKNSNTKKPRSSSSPKSGASHLSNPCFEEIFNFLVEQAVSLLTLKYKYENNLNKQLGFISFPVTEALMGLFLGFKKVKGSHIVLSSEMDWNSLLRKLQEAEQVLQASRQASQAPVSQAPASQASSNSAKPGHNRVHTSLVGVSQHSTKSPPIQPVPATKSNQNQATEPGISLIADTSTDQLLSPWESITAEKQASKSLSQPRPFMSSDPGMGSSLPENYEMVNTEDNAEAEGKGNKEDKGEDVDSYKDKSNYQDHLDPGQEAMSRYSVDTGHGDPP